MFTSQQQQHRDHRDDVRVRLLGQYTSPDKQREAIEKYIKVRLDRLEIERENYDINDGSHDIEDIFDNIKDGTLQRMFESSGIPYTNENIAERLDAANLRRVTALANPVTFPPRVLAPNPVASFFGRALEDDVDTQVRREWRKDNNNELINTKVILDRFRVVTLLQLKYIPYQLVFVLNLVLVFVVDLVELKKQKMYAAKINHMEYNQEAALIDKKALPLKFAHILMVS